MSAFLVWAALIIHTVVVPSVRSLRLRGKGANAHNPFCGDVGCRARGLSDPGGYSIPSMKDATCRCCWRDCENELDDETGQPQPNIAPQLDIRSASDVDAWIYPRSQYYYETSRTIFAPIVETVVYGLRKVASDVRVVGSPAYEDMRAGIRAAAAKGKRPLVVAIGCTLKESDLEITIANLTQLREAGAYLVLYQTEPSLEGPERMVPLAHATGAHEVWDYALANVDDYPEDFGTKVRYVPPGYTPNLEVGVQLTSELRDETHIGYMGSIEYKPIYAKYNETLGEIFLPTNSVETPADLRQYLQTLPMQLNFHKNQTCCPRNAWEKSHMHMEAFRFSELLSNKACVVSAPGSDKDNAKWAPVLHIVEVEDTLAKFKELSKNVIQCQLEAFERFKVDFDAESLLRKSGFFDAWSPLRLNSM